MRSRPKKAKPKKAKKAKKPSGNPFSPNLTDTERARRLNGRRVVQVNDKGEREIHLDVKFHRYLPRGKTTGGGERKTNLVQFFTSEGKQTVAVREISEVL